MGIEIWIATSIGYVLAQDFNHVELLLKQGGKLYKIVTKEIDPFLGREVHRIQFFNGDFNVK